MLDVVAIYVILALCCLALKGKLDFVAIYVILTLLYARFTSFRAIYVVYSDPTSARIVAIEQLTGLD